MNRIMALIFFVGTTSLLLPGCWSSLELRKSSLVMGTAVDRKHNGYSVSVEILGTKGSANEQSDTKAIVLREDGKNLHDAARELIRLSKRRLIFTHNRVWILSERTAKDDLMTPLDVIQRDQMLRLTSYVFITSDNPQSLLGKGLFRSSPSIELATGMKNVQFVSDFASEDLRQFLEMMNRPTQAGYLPIINLSKSPNSVIGLRGTALIKKNKMVGILSPEETMGLLWIRGNVHGGSIKARLSNGTTVQVEILKSHTKLRPVIRQGHLSVDISVNVKGTLANVPVQQAVTQAFIHTVEERASEGIQEEIQDCLHKLQHSYRCDVTKIGVRLYQRDPRDWEKYGRRWDETFSQANIHVSVKTDVTHPGLILNGANRPNHQFKIFGRT